MGYNNRLHKGIAPKNVIWGNDGAMDIWIKCWYSIICIKQYPKTVFWGIGAIWFKK